MDIGSWLLSLGLGQYEAAFRDNSIDAEVLPELPTETSKSAWRTPRAPQAPAQGDCGISPGGQDRAADKSCSIDEQPQNAVRSP